MAETASSFDFVIVGGGPAACVAASRLAGTYGFTVALIERGSASAGAGYRAPHGHVRPLANGHGLEVGQAAVLASSGDRHPRVPLANVLGGGSAVGGMIWQTGQREDYDAWAYYVGRTAGWAYDDLLPHILALESQQLMFGSGFGSDGPVPVGPPTRLDPMSRAFLKAAQARGFDLLPALAQGSRTGAGPLQFTLNHGAKGPERADAASLFLRDRHGGRLTVMTGRHVRRILFEGKRAIGVEVAGKGEPSDIRAKREVLLAAGAIHSPQLLQLSGLGPGARLQDLGIEVRVDLPGVGSNLQDHVDLPLYLSAGNGHGYHGVRSGLKGLRNRLNYRWFGGGPLVSPGIEAGLFAVPGSDSRPEVLVTLLPAILADSGLSLKSRAGATLAATLLRPKARGSVRLKSADPADPPLIDTKLLDHEDDRRRLIEAFRLMRDLAAAAPLADVLEDELHPGAGTTSETEIQNWLARAARPAGHFAGTARMGPSHDPLAVLDSRLVVRGVDGLRVIDTSVMPFITSGGTLAPAMMIGRHAAEIVAQDHKTAAEPATMAQAAMAAAVVTAPAEPAPAEQPDEAVAEPDSAQVSVAGESADAKPRRLSLARFAAALSASGKRETEAAGPAQLVDDLADVAEVEKELQDSAEVAGAVAQAPESPADIEDLMAEMVTAETVERGTPSLTEDAADPVEAAAEEFGRDEPENTAPEQEDSPLSGSAGPVTQEVPVPPEFGQDDLGPDVNLGGDIGEGNPEQGDAAPDDERPADLIAPADPDPAIEVDETGNGDVSVPEHPAPEVREPVTPERAPPPPLKAPEPVAAPPAGVGIPGTAHRPPPYQPMTESGRAEAEAARRGIPAPPPVAPSPKPPAPSSPAPPKPAAPSVPVDTVPRAPSPSPRPDWPALKSVRDAVNAPAEPKAATETPGGSVESQENAASQDGPAKPEKKPAVNVPDELTDLP